MSLQPRAIWKRTAVSANADLAVPGVPEAAVGKLRYLLGFSRLTTFQPGAASNGFSSSRPDVTVADEVARRTLGAILQAKPRPGGRHEGDDRMQDLLGEVAARAQYPVRRLDRQVPTTLSPIDLVPTPDRFGNALNWGEASVEPIIPMLAKLLEPVAWED